MAEIKPIEIVRKGYRFRSKLEAKWSVFFDALGIQWEYEPEGFQLPSGKWYEPDFRLSGFCGRGPFNKNESKFLWCEVKGVDDWDDLMERKKDDYQKVYEFSGFEIFLDAKFAEEVINDLPFNEHVDINEILSKTNPIIVLPNIPEDSDDWWEKYVSNFELVDGDSWPCIITKSSLSGKNFVLCGPDGESRPTWYEEYFTNEALKRARSVRFDHGEHGEFEPIKIPDRFWKNDDDDGLPF